MQRCQRQRHRKAERSRESDIYRILYLRGQEKTVPIDQLYETFDRVHPEDLRRARLALELQQWHLTSPADRERIYYEIMPRIMLNEEFKRRAVDLYDCGVQRIALWDTYGRAPAKVMWSTVSRIGHKDELPNLDPGEGEYYRLLRIGKLGAYDISRYNPSWGG
jgi:hypothetical protein